MRPLLLAVLLLVAGCAPRTAVVAPGASLAAGLAALDTTALRAHTTALSSDAYEGRGTGTRGEQMTVDYLIERFRALGLEGGMPDGGFVQRVPLRSVTLTEASPLAFRGGAADVELAFGPDATVSTDTEDASVTLDGARVVFVGYGIANPGERWDDYKDVDVRGAVLVGFVNEPPATAAEPRLFGADTMTYNGRWTYKYEEARRRGARGMFLIHTEPTASYPFSVLNGDVFGAHTTGETVPAGALDAHGWISEAAGRQLAEASGSTLEDWFAMAATRDFRPMELPVTAHAQLRFAHAAGVVGQNVVARLPGTTHAGEAVVYGAHHDHLGIDAEREARGEDGIYNGAVDNATGVAMMLEIAEAFAAGPRPARSVYFVTFSAEESGLLGSDHFVRQPPVPMVNVVANVNVDSGNLFGATDDIVGIGAERSEMQRLLREAAAAEGLVVTGETTPGAGLFFRSDQLAFARAGVPAVFLNTGDRFRGRPADYGATVRGAYRSRDYHQVSDELRPGMRFDGLLQQTRVAFRIGHALATNPALRPAWRAGEAFGETRRASERAAGR